MTSSAPQRRDREARVSRSFVALVDNLVEDYDVIDLLDTLVAHSVDLLAADAAGILLGDAHEHLRAVASSSDDATTMELLALQAADSPCVACYRGVAPVSVPDISTVGSRWPEFVAAVRQAGAYRSVHALPLRLRGRAIGVLSLFHHRPGPLPAEDLTLGQALADVATIAILSERAVRRGEIVTEQLQVALTSRGVIEQAKGVIAQHTGLGMDAAFALLRDHGRRHDRRLGDLARRIVARELDPATLRSDDLGDRGR